MDRRRFMARLTGAMGVVAAGLTSIPFLRSLLPSARALALGGPVSIDLSGFEVGEVKTFLWRGNPILVMRRGKEQLEALRLTKDKVLDSARGAESQPEYVDPRYRSIDPEYLVVVGNCTHAGCVPKADVEKWRSLVGDWWPGGFHCPCHGSMYDFAGRVVRGPAPRNLQVPPYTFTRDGMLIVGDDGTTS